ncbi:MAG TPA: AarF/ABC1/UbiB kinase family protein [Thermomicrobiaceae bacterium]|nr:AarF/ABC1/UbiB kinase family protein [Thermomicrobiaceae bacterium]
MPPLSLRRPVFTHRRRYTEIITVLSRHGLGWMIDQFGLGTIVPFDRGVFRQSRARRSISQPEHLRMALEDLGTTFIKLGQILSTREDLLPPAYIAELAKLREEVPPVPAEVIIAEIESSFGRPLGELYAEFDPHPIAAASIGQVHAARLPGGTSVVVKVQKPGIAEQVEEDLAILGQLARFARHRAPLSEAYDLVALVEEFGWTLRSELDYLREGRNAEQFRHDFADSPDVVIPRVFWDRTTTRVITLQRLDGLHIDDLSALDRAGIDRRALAQRAARLILDEVFVHRIFHADPHPGNFAVRPDGKIAAFDFGMVGRIDDTTRDALLSLIDAVLIQDAEGIVDGLASLSVLRHGSDRGGLRRDIQHLMDRYYGLSLSEYRFDLMFQDMMSIVRRRRLQLPAEMSLLMKTLSMYEGVGRRLDPGFQPFDVAEPYVRRAVIERYLPRSWLPRAISSSDEAIRLAGTLPRRANRLLTRAEQGDLEVAMRVVETDDLIIQAQVMVNRLVVAILTAASLISLGLLLTVYHPASLIDWLGPLLVIGAFVTLLGSAYLGIRILRSTRRSD